MDILIGCETSGTVREAFLALGHNAWSCDILPSDTPTNRHIQGDLLQVMNDSKWDMLLIAHPPCTRLCNSGVRWLHTPPPGKTVEKMWKDLDEGAAFFSKIWNARIEKKVIENPVMHKYAKARIVNYKPFMQSVHPWQFAHGSDSPDNVKKRTCLWGENVPLLVPTGDQDGSTARADIHNAPPGPDRWKIRSKFFSGMAKAMALQWGGDIRKENCYV